jgi:TolB-like protein
MKKNKFLRLVLLLLCIASVLLHVCYLGRGIASGDQVAVLPFEINADEDIEYIHRGIRVMISSRIAGGDHITVIEHNVVRDVLAVVTPTKLTNKVVQDIGSRLGADYVVFGSITKIGNNLSIDIKLLSVLSGGIAVPVFTQSLGLDEVIPEITVLAQEIRGIISTGFEDLKPKTTGIELPEANETVLKEESETGGVETEKVEEVDLADDSTQLEESVSPSDGVSDENKDKGEFISEQLTEPEGLRESNLKRKNEIDSLDENPVYQNSVDDLDKIPETNRKGISE